MGEKFLSFYRICNKLLGGRGLSKYKLFREIKLLFLSKARNNFTIVNGDKMFLDEQDCLQISIHKIYEPLETELVKKLVKKGDVVLDLGANIGYYTLLMAKLVGDKGKVFSFEPEPQNFTLLKKNVEINNYQNVTLEECAIGKKSGKTELFLSEFGAAMHTIYESEYCHKPIEIKIVSLDDYFNNKELKNKISFIKIDIEGSEFPCLQGMRNILNANNSLKLLIEFMPEALIDFGTDPQKLLDFLVSNSFKISYINSRNGKLIPLENKEILVSNCHGRSLFCEKV